MKKLLSLTLGALLTIGLASCNSNSVDREKVLSAEADGFTFHYTGASVDGGKWAADADNKMTAVSINQVGEKDSALADLLAKKNVKYLYMVEGLEFGSTSAGWTTNCKIDGELKVADACYTLKSIRATYNEEDDAFINDQWISDPKTAHAESLTPSTMFFPTWQEEADAEGFAWDQNPVVIGGAGTYTFVVAQYKNASSAKKAGFGFALLKTADNPDGIEYQEKWVFDHYRLVGSLAEATWDTNSTAAALQFNAENAIDYTFRADDEFQVIEANAKGAGTWTGQKGSSAVDTEASATDVLDLTGDNIKVTSAVSLHIVVNAEGKLVITK